MIKDIVMEGNEARAVRATVIDELLNNFGSPLTWEMCKEYIGQPESEEELRVHVDYTCEEER